MLALKIIGIIVAALLLIAGSAGSKKMHIAYAYRNNGSDAMFAFADDSTTTTSTLDTLTYAVGGVSEKKWLLHYILEI